MAITDTYLCVAHSGAFTDTCLTHAFTDKSCLLSKPRRAITDCQILENLTHCILKYDTDSWTFFFAYLPYLCPSVTIHH